MIMKFKNGNSQCLAALHQLANSSETQFILKKPIGWNSRGNLENGGREDLPIGPAITVFENKHEGQQLHSMTIEVAELQWVPYDKEEAESKGLEWNVDWCYGYRKIPVPRLVVNRILDVLERFMDFEENHESLEAEESDTSLLKRLTTVKVSGAEKFCVQDHIESANVDYMGENFKKQFSNKTEENIGDAVIAIDQLERNSNNTHVMAELGEKAEIKLVHLFSLLEAQSKGQKGTLSTDGKANIAYIMDDNGILWAVDANWHSGRRCWDISAYSVEGPLGWRAGYRVFSRDFLSL